MSGVTVVSNVKVGLVTVTNIGGCNSVRHCNLFVAWSVAWPAIHQMYYILGSCSCGKDSKNQCHYCNFWCIILKVSLANGVADVEMYAFPWAAESTAEKMAAMTTFNSRFSLLNCTTVFHYTMSPTRANVPYSSTWQVYAYRLSRNARDHFCCSMLVTSCSDVLGHWVPFFKNNCHCIALNKIVILHWCFGSRYWLHQSNQHLVSIHLFLVLGSLFLSLYSYFIPLCCQEIIHMLQLWARGLEITPFLHFIFFSFCVFQHLVEWPKKHKKVWARLSLAHFDILYLWKMWN